MTEPASDQPPPDDPHPPLRFGRVFWISLALGLACVIAGYAFSRLAPALLPGPRSDLSSAWSRG